MNKYFIKLVLIIVVSIQFGCENKNNKLIQSETHNIDWLIKQSDNKKLNLSEKFYYSFLAENALKKKKYDSISKIQYQNLILAYYNLDDKTKFVNICKELMKKSSKIEDFETIGVTKFNLASFYLKKFETDSAFFIITMLKKS